MQQTPFFLHHGAAIGVDRDHRLRCTEREVVVFQFVALSGAVWGIADDSGQRYVGVGDDGVLRMVDTTAPLAAAFQWHVTNVGENVVALLSGPSCAAVDDDDGIVRLVDADAPPSLLPPAAHFTLVCAHPVRMPARFTHHDLVGWWTHHSDHELFHWAENLLFWLDHEGRVNEARMAAIQALLEPERDTEAILRGLADTTSHSRDTLARLAAQAAFVYTATGAHLRRGRRTLTTR